MLCYVMCSDRKFASVMRHADINTNGIINRNEIHQFLFSDREMKFQIMVCMYYVFSCFSVVFVVVAHKHGSSGLMCVFVCLCYMPMSFFSPLLFVGV
jgi:hypothetical protein